MTRQPPAVTPELAEAALSCVPLARARKLAEWIGDGRQLTASGVLKPALATEACRALGIELPPGRLRSALDVDELMRDWDVACFAGLIISGSRHVHMTERLADSSPDSVLRSWVRVAAAPFGLPDEPCPGCLTVLHELSVADGALGMARLEQAVRSVEQPENAHVPCHGCGEVHDLPGAAGLPGDDDGLGGSLEHAAKAVACLVDYGAATALGIARAPGDGITGPGGTREGRVRLTDLGRMLAESIFTECAPAADAATLISMISVVPPKIAMQMAAPWLAARSPVHAVRELLGYAESADAAQRMIAMAFASSVGPQAAPAWREWAVRPGSGAYARMWLAEQGEPVTEHPADHAWMIVEALSVANAVVPPELTPLVFGAALQNATVNEAAEALSLMGGSGHPDAARFIESVAAVTGMRIPAISQAQRAAAPAGDVYQLKITLRGVSKPPVWRRVSVPAGLTLESLHEVILRAMDWDGGHLHVFSTAWQDYGTPDPDLGHADERKVTLGEVLAGAGDKMRYTYDFGDDWEHDIVLEKVLPADPGAAGPSCLAGKGACPPEDCGGVWGYAGLKEILADPDHEEHEDILQWLGLDSAADFDPAEFRIEMANARLSYLT